MKKSQLIKIIKESVKQLMTEQGQQGPGPITNTFSDFLVFTQNTPGLAFNWRCYWGMRSYANTILSLPNFTSTNQNQPCNFINQRIQHFTNLLAQAGPNSQSASIWQCKLDFFNALAQQYNC
tara:strand:- start:2008 stop:2373 length:366 start_codon:yes stop_codon:yes gene_type:complete